MITKALRNGLLLAGLMLASAASVKIAIALRWLEAGSASRALGVAIGLALAGYANFIPKSVPACQGADKAGGRSQLVARLTGWAFVLAGLSFAGIWAFAPLSAADPISTAMIGIAIAITFGLLLWALSRRSPEGSAG